MTMRARLIEVAARRAQLAERARAEREALAALVARGDAIAGWVEGVRGTIEALARHRLAVAAAFAVIALLRPRRVFKLVAGGWSLWRLYRNARRWWVRMAAAGAPAGTRV